VGDAILAATLPEHAGRRNDKLFELARVLKAHPALCDAEPKTLRPIVARWHRLALPIISTKPFEESWIDFLRGWTRVKYPKGTGPMDAIFERPRKVPTPAVALQYEQPALRLLVALCQELQRANGDAPFYLGCRTAGQLLGVDHTTAWRWLYLLVEDRLLVETEKGSQTGGRQRASRYRFVGGCQ
jgi:hypothetical protein